MKDISLLCPERHFHDDFTSPRQDTNLAHAPSRSFLRIGDGVFKRGRPCEKRRSWRGCSSANLPSEAKGLNFDYLWSHVVSPTKGDRDTLFQPLSCFCGKLLDIIRASAVVWTCSISFVDGRRAVLDGNETPSVEAHDCSRTSSHERPLRVVLSLFDRVSSAQWNRAERESCRGQLSLPPPVGRRLL